MSQEWADLNLAMAEFKGQVKETGERRKDSALAKAAC